MTRPLASGTSRARFDILRALVFAGIMLLIPFAGKLAARIGFGVSADFAQRALMVVIGAFIATIGNEIPKRIVPLHRQASDPARVQALFRFTGWTWAVTGLLLALAWLILPIDAAQALTFVVVPGGMALVTYRVIRSLASGELDDGPAVGSGAA